MTGLRKFIGFALLVGASILIIWWRLPRTWWNWVAIAVISTLVFAVIATWLLGPAARWLAERSLSFPGVIQTELDSSERLDILSSARHTLIQALTGVVVIAGIAVTASGLVYSARTVETTKESVQVTRAGQIGDRYSRAIEELGSDDLDVRVGGIYALQHVGRESYPDANTVCEVLAAFIREHSPNEKKDIPSEPWGDMQAALTVTGRIIKFWYPDKLRDCRPNLSRIQIPGADLRGAYLPAADLEGANLRGADLQGAVLEGSDLRGADLRGITGITPDRIRSTAVTDSRTNF